MIAMNNNNELLITDNIVGSKITSKKINKDNRFANYEGMHLWDTNKIKKTSVENENIVEKDELLETMLND